MMNGFQMAVDPLVDTDRMYSVLYESVMKSMRELMDDLKMKATDMETNDVSLVRTGLSVSIGFGGQPVVPKWRSAFRHFYYPLFI